MTKRKNGTSSLLGGICIAAVATTPALNAQENGSEDLEEITMWRVNQDENSATIRMRKSRG